MNAKLILAQFLTSFLLLACSKEQAATRVVTPDTAKPAEAKSVVTIAPSNMSVGLPAKLCGVLKKITPEIRNMPPVAARAQLVMAIAAAFDTDPAVLQEVSEKIDAIASESCSVEREILLPVMKMKSLREAVS